VRGEGVVAREADHVRVADGPGVAGSFVVA
jgi:hypothetical protein